MKATTNDQLPVGLDTSINWSVNAASVLELFSKYGSLDQFEERVLDRKMRQVTKESAAKYTAPQLIQKRGELAAQIEQLMVEYMEDFPVKIYAAQVENISLPEEYLARVREKEEQRERTEKERYVLEQQQLQAQQKVNTANAEAESKRIQADADAYAIRERAKAEADRIELLNKQLARSPNYLTLRWTEQWDGILPKTMLGDTSGVLLNLPAQK